VGGKDRSADGLRGIAALSVCIKHFVAVFVPCLLHYNYPNSSPEAPPVDGLYSWLATPIVSLFYNGHFAVALFFVMSGYVLSKPHFEGRPESVLKRRLWARYVRLNLPIAVAVLMSFLVYRLGIYSNETAASISGAKGWPLDLMDGGVSFSEALAAASYKSILMGENQLNVALWTLRIEFVGSVLLLTYFLMRPDGGLFISWIMAIIGLVFFFRGSAVFFVAIFAGALLNMRKLDVQWRLPALILGAYLGAYQYERVAYEVLPGALQMGMASGFDKDLYNSIGAFFTVWAVVSGFGEAVFQSRIAQFLGKISFSLYLTHFMVLCSMSSAMFLWLPRTGGMVMLNAVVYLLVSFAVAAAFERWVDRAAIHIAGRFADRLVRG
jgi:peptidoglycan/LPS O-acetylase OafA/YrhL